MNTILSAPHDHHGTVRLEFQKGKTRGLKLASLFSKIYDGSIRDTIRKHAGPEFMSSISIVATGGFGRSEIFPLSDIDILFLVDKSANIPESQIKNIVYAIWDMKLDLGYSIRTSEESLSLSKKDMKVFTSLLDARFITGSKKIFNSFRDKFIKDVLSRSTDAFIGEMIRMRATRTGRFENSVYILEPDLKEGQGGIRDYNTSLWLLKVCFGARRFEELVGRGFLRMRTLRDFREALNLVFDLRHRLHTASRIKTDRLSFEMQKAIAKEKRFVSSRVSTDVEKLMRTYYRAAEKIDSFCELMIEKAKTFESDRLQRNVKPKRIEGVFGRTDRHIITMSGKGFIKTPANIIKAFNYSKKFRLPLHNLLEESVSDFVAGLKNYKWNKRSLRIFRNMFGDDVWLYKTLKSMNRLDVLENLLPEFKRIKNKYQQDIYHVYTVDAHSLKTIDAISKLQDKDVKNVFPFLSNLMQGLKRKEKAALFLAALLHDIGKGRGGDHSRLGKKIALEVATNLDCPMDQAERIGFLVENHLLMPIFSQRRNLDDPVMLHQFISKVGNLKNLQLLYLLTYGDLSSVSQKGKAFTSWKNLLLRELYEKSVELFSLGKYRRWIFGKEILSFKRRMLKDISDKETRRSFRKFIGSLPESYFRSFSQDEIKGHFSMFKKLGKRAFVYQTWPVEDYGITGLAFCTKDFPGLFASLAGALSASKINILSSLVFSTDDGLALDVFRVVGKDGEEIGLDDPVWKTFDGLMKLALESREDFAKEATRRLKKQSSILDVAIPQEKPALRLDNESSNDFSILEVYAGDRLGLLYDLASLLSEFSVSIHFAKISTVGQRAQDIFYLTDLKGKKLKNRQLINAIKTKIARILAS